MKKIRVIAMILMIVLLSVFLIADGRTTGHVDGYIQVYNLQYGTWSPSDGETVNVKIWNSNGNEQCYLWPVTDNGDYDANFVGAQGATACNQVRVIFRGQTYTDSFVYSTGATIDIDFYPDR